MTEHLVLGWIFDERTRGVEVSHVAAHPVRIDDVMTITDASARGLSWDVLQSSRWQRLACGVYARSHQRMTPLLEIAAVARRLPVEAAFSGRTAGWLHGLDLPPCSPVDVTVPAGHVIAHRAGVRFHKRLLAESDVVIRASFRTTSLLRTLADLGGVRDTIEAVIALDMALNSGLASQAELLALPFRFAGRKGVARLRRAVALSDIAESPMETRLRLLLVRAGLPKPEPQVNLFNRSGEFIARTDLYYASHRLCIEFDGGQHRDLLIDDNRRQNLLVQAGFIVLRFTSADVLGNPDRVIAIVRAALSRPPLPDFSRNLAPGGAEGPVFSRNRARGGISA